MSFNSNNFNHISEASHMRLNYCANLMNQISNIACGINISPNQNSNSVPLAISKSQFTWVKKRSGIEKTKQYLSDLKRFENFWLENSISNDSNGEKIDHFPMCSDVCDLDPNKDQKDEAMVALFYEKLDVALNSSNSNKFLNFIGLVEEFKNAECDVVLVEKFKMIKNEIDSINRPDLLTEFIQLMTPSQALKCKVSKIYQNYHISRQIYVLLEQLYEEEVNEEFEENLSDVGMNDANKKQIKLIKKKQKLKSFDNFIKKLKGILSTLESNQNHQNHQNIKSQILKLLKGRPLLQRLITVHLFQEYTADMFEPEMCTFTTNNQFNNFSNIEYIPSTNTLKTINEKKRIPKGYGSIISKNVPAELPLASTPMEFNFPKVAEEILKSAGVKDKNINLKFKINNEQNDQNVNKTANIDKIQNEFYNNQINHQLSPLPQQDLLCENANEPPELNQNENSNIDTNLQSQNVKFSFSNTSQIPLSSLIPKDQTTENDNFSAIQTNQMSQSSTLSGVTTVDGLMTTEEAFKHFSLEAAIWSNETINVLSLEWDNFEFPEDAEEDDDTLIDNFCKNIEEKIGKPWELIREKLDELCREQESDEIEN